MALIVDWWRSTPEQLGLAAPLLLSYVATACGVAMATHYRAGLDLYVYLILSSFVPQFGLWGDWGRGSAYLVRARRPAMGVRWSLRDLDLGVPILCAPTVLAGALALEAVPLLHRAGLLFVAGQVALAVTATCLVVMGNVWRQHVLLAGDVRDYFWLQLWVAGGLPLAMAVCPIAGLGAVLVGAAYFWHVRRIVQGHQRLSSCYRGPSSAVRSVVAGDRFTWEVGGTQLLAGLSATVEVPLLILAGSHDLLAFYAISRITQASAALATRPLEAGMPALLSGDLTVWRRRVYQAAVATVILVGAILTVGRLAAGLWVGSTAGLTPLLVVGGASALIAGVIYRVVAIAAVARAAGTNLLAMAGTELIVKIGLSALLVPLLGGAGLLLAGSGSAAATSALGLRKAR